MDLSTIISSRPGTFTQLTFWSVELNCFIYDYLFVLSYSFLVFLSPCINVQPTKNPPRLVISGGLQKIYINFDLDFFTSRCWDWLAHNLGRPILISK
jgi:hypothetical protein